MRSAVRFSNGYARLRARKRELWQCTDRALLLRAGIDASGRRISGSLAEIYPGLLAWYGLLVRTYTAAAGLWLALLRLHEIDNLKVLWRASVRGHAPQRAHWRPLGTLETLPFIDHHLEPDALSETLSRTPYSEPAASMFKAGDALAAAEIALDRWAWLRVWTEARRLPAGEAAAWVLVRLLIVEHDLELLHRGCAAGLDADLVARSTIVLGAECPESALVALALWEPARGPLARLMPRPLRRYVTDRAALWDDVTRAVQVERRRACQRAFVGWPYRLAPAVAALLLREAQFRAELSIAAVRRGGSGGQESLPLALAPSALEA